MGPVMADVLPDAWRAAGQRGVQRLIDAAKASRTHGMRIRWVWFDVLPGTPDAPGRRESG